jgi:hypothetical protein
MKALSTTLIIVISAVVILVAALVVLTIFGQGTGQIATLAQAKTICQSSGSTTCAQSGVLPLTWGLPDKNVAGTMMTCQKIMDVECGDDGCKCNDYGFSIPSG